jgi:hypothetical protein
VIKIINDIDLGTSKEETYSECLKIAVNTLESFNYNLEVNHECQACGNNYAHSKELDKALQAIENRLGLTKEK